MEVKSAITFERGVDVFKDYVNKYYKIKKDSKGVMKEIAKLFLNSLYGRFGMKVDLEVTDIVSHMESERILKLYNVNELIELESDRFIINYNRRPSKDRTDEINYLKELDKYMKDIGRVEANVAIASAIASYSRIIMYPFKTIPGNDCLYSDTDSIVLRKALDDRYIGTDLGLFKREYGDIKRGYFITSKLYLLELADNNIICKHKGFKSNFSIDDFENLYRNESITKTETHFRVSLMERYVRTKMGNKTAKSTLTKRRKVIDNGN